MAMHNFLYNIGAKKEELAIPIFVGIAVFAKLFV